MKPRGAVNAAPAAAWVFLLAWAISAAGWGAAWAQLPASPSGKAAGGAPAAVPLGTRARRLATVGARSVTVGVGGLALSGLVGCTPALDWREVRPVAGVVALFPCKPTSLTRELRLAGEGRIGQGPDLGFQTVDLIDDGAVAFNLPVVGRTEDSSDE